jgi:hypothetical protein
MVFFLTASSIEANDLVGIQFGKVNGLVQLVFFLDRRNAVLAGLGQVEAGAAGGPQLGNHFFVV